MNHPSQAINGINEQHVVHQSQHSLSYSMTQPTPPYHGGQQVQPQQTPPYVHHQQYHSQQPSSHHGQQHGQQLSQNSQRPHSARRGKQMFGNPQMNFDFKAPSPRLPAEGTSPGNGGGRKRMSAMSPPTLS